MLLLEEGLGSEARVLSAAWAGVRVGILEVEKALSGHPSIQAAAARSWQTQTGQQDLLH